MPQSNSANIEIQAQQDVSKADLVRHNEHICALKTNNAEVIAYQKILAAELAEVYEKGAPKIKSNKWKAKQYHAQAGNQAKADAVKDTAFRTQNVYSALGWFNDARQFTVRLMTVLVASKVVLSSLFVTVVSAMGLFFAARLSFDLAMIFKGVFYPEGQAEKNLSKWDRFIAVMKKDDRMYRMANDAVWFSINLTAMILTGGLSIAGVVVSSALLNLGGFAFDTVAEMTRWREVNALQQTILDVNARKKVVEKDPAFVEIAEQINEKRRQIQLCLDFIEINKVKQVSDETLVLQRMANLTNEIGALQATSIYREYTKFVTIEEQLNEKLKAAKWERLKIIGIVAMVCFGAALTLFPGTLPAGIVLLGAIVGLFGGSVFNGFIDKLRKKFTSQATAVEANADVESAANDIHIVPNANALLNQHQASSVIANHEKSIATTSVEPVHYSPSHYGLYDHSMDNQDEVEESQVKLNLDFAKTAFH